jgi:hypothetical protein
MLRSFGTCCAPLMSDGIVRHKQCGILPAWAPRPDCRSTLGLSGWQAMRKKCCIQLSHPTAWLGWLQVAQQPRAQLHVGLPQKRRIHSGGADRAANVHGALCEFARHGYRHWCEETWRDEPLPCHGVLYYRVQVTGLALACPTARLTQSATDSRLTRALGTGAGRLGTRCLIDLGWCRRVWVRVHWEAVWSLQREAQCLLALTVGWQKGRRRRSG